MKAYKIFDIFMSNRERDILVQKMFVKNNRAWSEGHEINPKKGGGVLCYIKEGIKYSDTKYAHLNVSGPVLEMQWIGLDLPNTRPIVIVNVYRPPQGKFKKGCSIILEKCMLADLSDKTEIYLLGDFNINIEDAKAPDTKELLFTTKALGLSQLVMDPTRIFFRDGIRKTSRLDLIFTNSDYIKETKTLDINISDHLAVMVTRKKEQVRREKVDFQGRTYRNYDREIFQNRLMNLDWEHFLEIEDPEILWDIMEGRLEREIEKMCPMKSFKVANIREPWITNEAIEAIKDKDRALKKAKRSGKGDWLEAKRIRNRVGRDLELLRSEFLKQKQEEHKTDHKKFWRVLGDIFPSKKSGSPTGPIWLKDKEKGLEVAAEQVPDFINKFFVNIGPKLASDKNDPWNYHGIRNLANIPDIETTREEVLNLCREINPMKSSGIDKLSSKICKDAFVVLPDKLAHIFNMSLREAIFPERWKSAKVVPLFKGGSREEVGNYRPVSLLSLPGKFLEKVVHTRISAFLGEHNFLSEHQGGFRKGHSTVSTIADLTDELFDEINRGKTTLAAFIDLSKAFDTVNTSILLAKLEQAGIRRNTLRWCKNYLTGRRQRTVANGASSGYLPVVCGVPQGSVLGPLFFLLYINDLENVMGDCNLKLYADDTVLYQSGDNCEEVEGRLQDSLNLFSKWCSANVLSINAKKTKLMAFGSRSKVKKCRRTKIMLNGERVKLVPSYKYLGVTLDPTLNYRQHVSSIIKCVQHKISLLGKVKRYLNNDVALKIYKSMILPYLDYADVIFCKANATDLDKLQKLQNRCLRLCMGQDRFFNTDRAHKNAETPFLADRRNAHTLNFMYKRKEMRGDLLNKREIRTRAHDAPLFKIIIPRCEAVKRSVGYFGAERWNALTPNVRNTNSYQEFKKLQKRDMLLPLNQII